MKLVVFGHQPAINIETEMAVLCAASNGKNSAGMPQFAIIAAGQCNMHGGGAKFSHDGVDYFALPCATWFTLDFTRLTVVPTQEVANGLCWAASTGTWAYHNVGVTHGIPAAVKEYFLAICEKDRFMEPLLPLLAQAKVAEPRTV